MQSFNNNYGYGYGAYNYQQPNNYYSYNQQPQYQQQNQQQLNLYAFVDGIEGAKAYQVKPNSMMLLMDSQQPICYKKSVNAMGQTIEFQAYKLVPVEQAQQPQCEYVSREEFTKEIASIKALFEKGE